MLAIDTNVIVRLLTGDEPGQAERARRLLDDNPVFVASTVIMEAEWVLRSAYGIAKAEVVRALKAFAGLPMVTLQDPEGVAAALDQAERGLDFSDALHRAGARSCEALLTFDKRFVKAAGYLHGPAVRLL